VAIRIAQPVDAQDYTIREIKQLMQKVRNGISEIGGEACGIEGSPRL
jgi:hypothetical protein